MKVSDWLTDIGLEQYHAVFDKHDIDAEVLVALRDADLVEMGITSLGHRKKLLLAAQNLPEPVMSDASVGASQGLEKTPERRQLTVLLCDLVGSTALATRFDPEEMGQLIGLYKQSVAAAVERYDGFVANYLGDGIVAYFGLPNAHENDPERAVRAGLEIAEVVAALSDPQGNALACRVGIATGLVVTGDVSGTGEDRWSVAGETPNLAARLQAVAAPGEVVVSAETRALLPGWVRTSALSPMTLKGLNDPIIPSRVTEIVPKDRVAFEKDWDKPVVGRDPELARLRSAWTSAKDGQAQVVLLKGQAGIGKSRLSAVFVNELEADGIHVDQFFGSSFHSGSPYHPIATGIERAARIQPEDGPATRLDKLDLHLAEAGLDPKEAGPFISPLLGLDPGERYPTPGLAPTALAGRTFDCLADLLLKRWQSTPHVILLEDAHWIDQTTTDLLHHLFERAVGQSVLILVTYRPNYHGMDQNAPIAKTEIEVLRLPGPECAQLISRVADGDGVSASVIEQIIDRSDGVPLYLEEMTKSYLTSVARSDKKDAIHAGASEPSGVPSSLSDSLMARLDQLATVGNIPQVSSVMGRRFTRSLLEEVAENSTKELDRALDELVRAELLFVGGDEADPTYTFKHALIRDAAYDTILLRDRPGLHLRAAEAMLKKVPEQVEAQPETIARHYQRAGQKTQAASYWLKSGRKGMAASAMTEALISLEHGLSLLQDSDIEADQAHLGFGLHSALGLAHISLKGWHAPEVEAHLRQAFEIGQQFDESIDLLFVIYGLWIHWLNRSEPERSAAWIEQAEARLRKGDNAGWVLIIHTMKLVQERWFGSDQRVREEAQAVLDHYDPELHGHLVHMFGNDPKVMAYGFRSWSHWLAGDTQAALADVADCEEASRQVAHPFDRCWQLLVGSLPYYFSGDRDGLARNLEEAKNLGLSQNIDFVTFITGPVWTGLLLILDEDWDGAIAAMEPGINAWRAGGGGVILPFWEGALGLAYARSGATDQAMSLYQSAIERAERSNETWFLPELHRLVAEITVETDRAAALSSLSAAKSIAAANGAHELMSRIESDLSAIHG
ncbi:MAG: adenylate/guanylate cyclase domain-containing protein [Pseudomonadota bacterium]